MGGLNADRDRAFHLGANLALGFVGLQVADGFGRVRPKISGGIEQTRDCILGCDRAPAVSAPLAGESQVQAEIGVGMGFRIGGNFGEPWAGNHDAGGGDGVTVERVETGSVLGVGDGEIVGVND